MLSILLRISNERGAVPNVAAPPPIHDGKQRKTYRLSGPVSSSPSSLHVVSCMKMSRKERFQICYFAKKRVSLWAETIDNRHEFHTEHIQGFGW